MLPSDNGFVWEISLEWARIRKEARGSYARKKFVSERDEIYSRASLGEHVAASVALSAPGGARSLEQVVPGWVQPARFRR